MAVPGIWYILVYVDAVATAPENFSLTAMVSPVVLSQLSPTQSGNGADQTITLTGAGFDSTTSVKLKAANGTEYPASQVQLDLPTQLSATFPSGALPPGTY